MCTTTVTLLYSAGWADSHLIPAEFGDHRANVLFEFAEVIECLPLVVLADEACPTHQWVVVPTGAEQACTSSVTGASVVVDSLCDCVNCDDVAREFTQRISWKASVEFGGVMDEDRRNLIEMLTFTDANHRSVTLHTSDNCSGFLGFRRETKSYFEIGCRQGGKGVLGFGHVFDRPWRSA